MDIDALDLNLLRVLQVVARERSVSYAAKKLGLSQPAVSSALKRLREAVGDPLVVRARSGVQLTPVGVALASAIDEAMMVISQNLPVRAPFDPSVSRHQFTLLMSDIGESVALPDLISLAQQEAPEVSFRIRQSTGRSYALELADGRADLLFGHLPRPQPSLISTHLYPTRLVCMYRRDHRLAALRMTTDDYFSARHIVSEKELQAPGALQIQADGRGREIALIVAHYACVPDILDKTDMVVTLSEGLAVSMGKHNPLHYQHLPFATGDLPVSLFWHERSQLDPANQWLRGLFLKLFRGR